MLVGNHDFTPDFPTPVLGLASSKKIYFSGKKDENIAALSSASAGAPGEQNCPAGWLRIKADTRSVGQSLPLGNRWPAARRRRIVRDSKSSLVCSMMLSTVCSEMGRTQM